LHKVNSEIELSITVCMNAQSSTENSSQNTAAEAREFCGNFRIGGAFVGAATGGVLGNAGGAVIGTAVGLVVGEAATKACESFVDRNTSSKSSKSSTVRTDPKNW